MQNEARKLIAGLAKAAAPSSDHDLNPDVVLHANLHALELWKYFYLVINEIYPTAYKKHKDH